MPPSLQYNKAEYFPTEEKVRAWAQTVIQEDLGKRDVTTDAVVPSNLSASACLTAKEPLILCGTSLAEAIFRELDPEIQVSPENRVDAESIEAGRVFYQIRGNCRALLKAERAALNILQRLSGIATLTRRYVEQARPAVILDTRKTTPGLRLFEKYAVHCGGGSNHRIGLYDAVLIKDNHIQVAGSISEAVRRVHLQDYSGMIEVEVTSQEEVEEALSCEVHRIMLDNMDRDQIVKAVKMIGTRAEIEISGNMTLDRVQELKDTGIKFISVGALTHSASAVDISMSILPE